MTPLDQIGLWESHSKHFYFIIILKLKTSNIYIKVKEYRVSMKTTIYIKVKGYRVSMKTTIYIKVKEYRVSMKTTIYIKVKEYRVSMKTTIDIKVKGYRVSVKTTRSNLLEMACAASFITSDASMGSFSKFIFLLFMINTLNFNT